MVKLPYKTVNNINYFKSFPDTWIEEESLYNVGPRFCENCKYYGSLDNIFIGYCVNCANNIFDGERGSGMSGNEIMLNPSEFDFEKCPYMSSLQKAQVKKAIFENNIEKIRIVPKPPILLRTFATETLDSPLDNCVFRYDEFFGYPHEPDSIS